jgi:hypothetical protein
MAIYMKVVYLRHDMFRPLTSHHQADSLLFLAYLTTHWITQIIASTDRMISKTVKCRRRERKRSWLNLRTFQETDCRDWEHRNYGQNFRSKGSRFEPGISRKQSSLLPYHFSGLASSSGYVLPSFSLFSVLDDGKSRGTFLPIRSLCSFCARSYSFSFVRCCDSELKAATFHCLMCVSV